MTSERLQSERINKREPTAEFNKLFCRDISPNNSKIIEKSNEDVLMSEINNDFEISYNILNSVDFATFKIDICGNWKIDFLNLAAKKLIE